MAREGRLDVSIEHRRIEKVMKWLVHGILSASLFMAVAMILSQAVQSTFRGFSIVGTALMILGFLLGFLLGFRLVRAMKKSGELRMPWVGLRMIVGMD